MATTPLQALKKAQRQQQVGNFAQKASGVISGATAIVGQGLGMIQEGKNIQTSAPAQQLDSFGKPLYNLGDFQTQVSAIRPQGATGGELLSGTLQGAQAGMAFGPVGAGIGAAVGALSTALFGKRRKTLQERRKTLAQRNLQAAQRLYNTGIEQFNAKTSAQSLYNEQLDLAQQRMYNVYQALS